MLWLRYPIMLSTAFNYITCLLFKCLLIDIKVIFRHHCAMATGLDLKRLLASFSFMIPVIIGYIMDFLHCCSRCY
ncbi:hypothetical protein F4810DRAFT_683434 [Camillea tinctor]|nr:hypothetical protein F4810DRAFT_683434 [Camillea tinctor]